MRAYILLSVLLGLAAGLPGKGNSNNNNNNNAAATTTTAAPTTTTPSTVVDGDVRILEYLTQSVLDFCKIKFGKSSSTTWIFNQQKSILKLIVAYYTGSKNSVRNRLKIQFVELRRLSGFAFDWVTVRLGIDRTFEAKRRLTTRKVLKVKILFFWSNSLVLCSLITVYTLL